jgi:hypothetical protein
MMWLTMKAQEDLLLMSQNMGYAPDFVHVGIGPYLSTIKQKGIVISSVFNLPSHS